MNRAEARRIMRGIPKRLLPYRSALHITASAMMRGRYLDPEKIAEVKRRRGMVNESQEAKPTFQSQ